MNAKRRIIQVISIETTDGGGVGLAPEAVVRWYYSCVDANDIAGLLRLFAPDAVYERPGFSPMVGWEAIRGFYESTRSIASGRHDLHSVITQECYVAVAGHFAGVLRDDRRAEVAFADFFEIADQLIIRRQTFFGVPAI